MGDEGGKTGRLYPWPSIRVRDWKMRIRLILIPARRDADDTDNKSENGTLWKMDEGGALDLGLASAGRGDGKG
jgi:hypothetical protein